MKQKNMIMWIFIMFVIIATLNGAYFVFLYIKSLDIHLTIEQWLMVCSALGVIFVVVDTIEIMLLRAGQRKWTHEPGKMAIEILNTAYEELSRNPEAQHKLMMLSANIGQAFMGGAPGEDGKPSGGPGNVANPKVDLPEKFEWAEKTLNKNSWLRRKFWDRVEGALGGGKGKGEQPQEAKGGGGLSPL